MNHTILTDTEFFNRIKSSEYKELPSAYNEFVARVIKHCHSATDIKHIAVALMYAEIELQFQQVQDDNEMSVYIQKALAFVKKNATTPYNNCYPSATTKSILQRK